MAHIVVDGYNVIRRVEAFASAEGASLEAGREALLFALESFGAKSGHSITAVFDGGGRIETKEGEQITREGKFAGVDVVFSPQGRTADDMIVDIVMRWKENGGYLGGGTEAVDLVIVSDDIDLKSSVASQGAYVISTLLFNEVIEKGMELVY